MDVKKANKERVHGVAAGLAWVAVAVSAIYTPIWVITSGQALKPALCALCLTAASVPTAVRLFKRMFGK